MTIENRYNVDMLRAVRDKVLMEPKSHYQRTWAQFKHKKPMKSIPDQSDVDPGIREDYYAVDCASTACVAGWAVLLAGGKMLVGKGSVDAALSTPGLRMNTQSRYCLTADGRQSGISAYGREVLGLTPEEGKNLFAGERTYEEVLTRLEGYIKAGELLHGR